MHRGHKGAAFVEPVESGCSVKNAATTPGGKDAMYLSDISFPIRIIIVLCALFAGS